MEDAPFGYGEGLAKAHALQPFSPPGRKLEKTPSRIRDFAHEQKNQSGMKDLPFGFGWGVGPSRGLASFFCKIQWQVLTGRTPFLMTLFPACHRKDSY